MQSDLFPNDTTDAGPAQSRSAPKKPHAPPPPGPGDGRPNLNTLDVRIYGLQIPMDTGTCSYRYDGMTDEEIAAHRKKHMPLKCVYTAEDFTEEGQVKLLRERDYSFWDIARDFPDLAEVAVRLAIDAGHAIA